MKALALVFLAVAAIVGIVWWLTSTRRQRQRDADIVAYKESQRRAREEEALRASAPPLPPLPRATSASLARTFVPAKPSSVLSPVAEPAWKDDGDADQFNITYQDSDGVITERRIRVVAIDIYGPSVYVRAHCALRGETRTFRADRMLSARRVSNDTRISLPLDFFTSLVPADQRPDPEHTKVLGRARNGLRVLIWIAHADRDIASDEMEVLLAFIEERSTLTSQKAPPWSRNRAIGQMDGERPTLALASGYLASMSPAGRELPMVRRYAEKITALGGLPAEKRFKQLFR